MSSATCARSWKRRWTASSLRSSVPATRDPQAPAARPRVRRTSRPTRPETRRSRTDAPAPRLQGEDDLAEQVTRDHGLEAVAGLRQRQDPVDHRADPGLLAEPGQPAE